MEITLIIDMIASQLGLTDNQLGITLLFIMLFSNLASRLIPDDSTGVLGVLNKVTKILGLYASNRISQGVTTTTAVKAMLPDEFFEDKGELGEKLEDMNPIAGVRPENQDPIVVAARVIARNAKAKTKTPAKKPK